MHRIARMIFAAKAGRAPRGAARFAYKSIAVFRLGFLHRQGSSEAIVCLACASLPCHGRGFHGLRGLLLKAELFAVASDVGGGAVFDVAAQERFGQGILQVLLDGAA